MPARSALANAMIAAAVGAARPLRRDFGEIENLVASRRGARDFAMRAARRVEESLARRLARARSDYTLFPTGAEKEEAGPAWLAAPVDGLGNLAHGVPHFATAIAAREDGRMAACVVYDPMRDELYWAERGVGAYVDQRRVRCSAAADANAAVVALAAPDGVSQARLAAAAGPAELRVTGAPALDIAYVASGRFDGFAGAVSAGALAAGGLLLREAGALTEAVLPRGAAAPLTLAAGSRLLGTLARRVAPLAAAAP